MSEPAELNLENLTHDLAAHLWYDYRHDEDWPIAESTYEGNVISAEFKDRQKFKITVEVVA